MNAGMWIAQGRRGTRPHWSAINPGSVDRRSVRTADVVMKIGASTDGSSRSTGWTSKCAVAGADKTDRVDSFFGDTGDVTSAIREDQFLWNDARRLGERRGDDETSSAAINVLTAAGVRASNRVAREVHSRPETAFVGNRQILDRGPLASPVHWRQASGRELIDNFETTSDDAVGSQPIWTAAKKSNAGNGGSTNRSLPMWDWGAISILFGEDGAWSTTVETEASCGRKESERFRSCWRATA